MSADEWNAIRHRVGFSVDRFPQVGASLDNPYMKWREYEMQCHAGIINGIVDKMEWLPIPKFSPKAPIIDGQQVTYAKDGSVWWGIWHFTSAEMADLIRWWQEQEKDESCPK